MTRTLVLLFLALLGCLRGQAGAEGERAVKPGWFSFFPCPAKCRTTASDKGGGWQPAAPADGAHPLPHS